MVGTAAKFAQNISRSKNVTGRLRTEGQTMIRNARRFTVPAPTTKAFTAGKMPKPPVANPSPKASNWISEPFKKFKAAGSPGNQVSGNAFIPGSGKIRI